jgi:hypothetical protein
VFSRSFWQTHGYQTVVMVGDGITDYEARTPGGADAFIGCVGASPGGVLAAPAVRTFSPLPAVAHGQTA